jgi:hypothetical protein
MRVATLTLLFIAFMSPQSHSRERLRGESDVSVRLAELEEEVARISRELSELRREPQGCQNQPGISQLNGRWRNVTATKGETVTRYAGVKNELVIDGQNEQRLLTGQNADGRAP